ncbi:MAG: hypothetical protein ACR2HG_04260 [Pyrinomonadaceae bacterium]
MFAKIKNHYLLIIVALLALPFAAQAQRTSSPAADPLATIFTFQGKLTDMGMPANATYDLKFDLYTDSTGGIFLGTVTKDDVMVTSGIFTVLLDFGAMSFNDNTGRYLEIGVRPGVSMGAFTTITTRQVLTASPYAIQAVNSEKLNGLPASSYLRSDANQTYSGNTLTIGASSTLNVQGTLNADGANLTNLNAGSITGGTLSDARLSANVVTLSGTQTITGNKNFQNLVDIQGLGTLRVRGTSQIDLINDTSVFLDFPSIPQGGSATLTVTVSGATFVDGVFLGLPSTNSNLVYTAYVSAVNTVTVRCNNVGTAGAIDPSSQGFRVVVFGFVF